MLTLVFRFANNIFVHILIHCVEKLFFRHMVHSWPGRVVPMCLALSETR